MNHLEQRIRKAAPPPSPAVFPIDVKTELEMIPHRADSVELVGATRPAAKDVRLGTWHRAVAFLIVLLATTAIWLAAVTVHPPEASDSTEDARIQPPPGSNSPVAHLAPGQSSAAYSLWRTAQISRPWTDAPSEITASIELPIEWKVFRHNASSYYSGLHVTIVDQDFLPVAMLYFGPAPAHAACRARDGQQTELERIGTKSGAELLDPSLGTAYSFSVSTGPEPRGSFALLPLAAPDGPCGPYRQAAEPPVVLNFGDVLNVGSLNGAEAPRRSGYARLFPSLEDARRYMKSAEYIALRRMITSLRFSFPANVAAPWQIPDGRFRDSS